MITRRDLLRGIAGTVGLLGWPPGHAFGEPLPGTTTLRISHSPSRCAAIRTGIAAVLLSITLCIPGPGQAQSRSTEQLGKVDFLNSCSPAVQETFQRSVAMLHSFWYTEAERTFREVLARDRRARLPPPGA